MKHRCQACKTKQAKPDLDLCCSIGCKRSWDEQIEQGYKPAKGKWLINALIASEFSFEDFQKCFGDLENSDLSK